MMKNVVSTQRPLRILFAMVQLGPGGVETNVLNLLEKLDRRQFAPGLFLHHQPSSPSRAVPDDVPVSSALQGGYSRVKLPHVLGKMMRVARDYDVIVAAQEGRATLIAFLAARMLGKPIVGCIQFDWLAFAQHLRKRQVVGLKMMCPRMDRIIACGNDAEHSLRTIVPQLNGQVQVIPNFVCADEVFRRAVAPPPMWATSVFAKPTVVSVGRLEPQKAYDVLLRAHARLRQQVDNHLLIIGEGSQRAALMRLAEELGVADSVYLPGFVSNPFPLVARADVFALSSKFEGLPFALIEAMTLGVPVAATDCPSGPREVLAGGRFGKLTPVGDDARLGAALTELLTDPRQRFQFGELAFSRAASFSDRQAVAAWQSMLQSL